MNEQQKKAIEDMIHSKKIFVFVKGTPENPACGFSLQVMQLFQSLKIDFGHFDIFSDPAMKEAIKEYTSWPTFPQVFINGTFIGGCDITVEMASNGELKQLLNAH